MGYSTKGSITNFWPDDTDTAMFIESNGYMSITDVIQKAKEKWGEDLDFDQLIIQADNIQTDCIYYDLYDSSDYTNFIVLEYNPQ